MSRTEEEMRFPWRASILTAVVVTGVTAPAKAQDIDSATVGKALGKEGAVQAGGVYRIGQAQRLGGLKAALALVNSKKS